MFTSRIFQRVGNRVQRATFAHASPVRDGVFREKNPKELWLGDKGAYPVMSIIVLGIVCGTGMGIYMMSTSPECKLLPGGSRSRMFRGELADEYLKEDVDFRK